LAAVDLHGRSGSLLRRRVVLGEFVVSAVLGGAAGVAILLSGHGWEGKAVAAAVIGVAANYALLSWHALRLRGERLVQAVPDGVEGSELRAAGLYSLVLFLPFALPVLAVRAAAERRR
jgi:hypothetical protein